MKPKIMVISDNSIIIDYPPIISEEINKTIRFVSREIVGKLNEYIIDIISAYHTITVGFDCLAVDPAMLVEELSKLVLQTFNFAIDDKNIVEIPVCYEEPYGMDLEYVCNIHSISREELIRKHSTPEYLVYMVGFTPGFPYLGGMDESLETPRKKQPRKRIAAGSVGIAGSQTGIYPIDSPGGWQIIGQTPVKLFDPYRQNPVMIEAGQYIKFRSISTEEFEQMKRRLEVPNG